MEVLVPVDNSDCSFRALEFATEFVRRYDGSLHVVHITDHGEEEATEVVQRAEDVLSEAGIEDEPEVVTDVRMSNLQYADRVGQDVLELVEEEGYDHVVMGTHDAGRIEGALLGSAAKTVVEDTEVPVTVVP